MPAKNFFQDIQRVKAAQEQCTAMQQALLGDAEANGLLRILNELLDAGTPNPIFSKASTMQGATLTATVDTFEPEQLAKLEAQIDDLQLNGIELRMARSKEPLEITLSTKAGDVSANDTLHRATLSIDLAQPELLENLEMALMSRRMPQLADGEEPNKQTMETARRIKSEVGALFAVFNPVKQVG